MSNAIRAATVAIVGAEEMGAAVATRLREAGAHALTTLSGRGAKSVERTSRVRCGTGLSLHSKVAAGYCFQVLPPSSERPTQR